MTATSPPTPPHKNIRPRKERRVRIIGVPRDEPDLKKFAKALVHMAVSQADEAARVRASRPSNDDAWHDKR